MYAPLHLHSIFSIRDGICKIDELMDKTKAYGLPAIALTDHGTLGGVISLFKYAKEYGIKPIAGVEAYMATRSRFDKQPGVDKYTHITLLAMNNQGWRNLIKLVSLSYNKDHFYYKPRIDRELLRMYNEGLICLSGCAGGALASAILKKHGIEKSFNQDGDFSNIECNHQENVLEDPEEIISWHKKIFGDRFYIEIQNHNTIEDSILLDSLPSLAKKYGIKLVATSDTHFIEKEDVLAHDIMLAIRDNITLSDPKMQNIKYPGNGYHLYSYKDMLERFSGFKEAIDNTLEIAERCNVNIEMGKNRLPQLYPSDKEDVVLRKLVFEGLRRRFGKSIDKKIYDRIEMELKTIEQTGYAGYFLIVQDYVLWAKSNGILVGPGRGSAAGCLISYALGITDVNPLDYDLSFARFLNKGRAAKPVISFKEYPYEIYEAEQCQMQSGLQATTQS